MSKYLIDGDTLTGIADAVRDMRHEKGALTPAEIEAKIRASRLGIPVEVSDHIAPDTGEWVRPAEWPDLDSVEIADDFDGVYLTYDLSKTPGYGWIGVRCKVTVGSYKVERGHLVDGEFVVDEEWTVASSVSFSQSLNNENGDIQLWRITSITGKIEAFGFCPFSPNSSKAYTNQLQPCVERVGRLDYLIINNSSFTWSTSANSADRRYGTFWLEHDAVKCAGKVNNTSLYNVWINCYALRSLEIDDWDTSNWEITTLEGCWQNCLSLKSLNLSSWDTSNWNVTSLKNCWNSCYSMESLDIGSWDTSGWVVTTLYSTWANCISLRVLDLSSWNTSGWSVTTLYYTWKDCNSLQSLDISSWDTSGWTVASLTNTWSNCYSLLSLDIGNWDTSEWTVDSLTYTWSNCYSLKALDFNNWNTSKWTVTTMSTCWYHCNSLVLLNINDWDTSNWVVTTLASCWSYCCSLQLLNLNNWNTTKWTVDTLAGCWSNCYSLQILQIDNWDTSGWTVTSLSSCWSNCISLRSLNLSDWDTSNWAVTTLYYCWNVCRSLESLDVSGWDTSGWTVADVRSMFGTDHRCKSIKTPATWHQTSIANANNHSANLYSLEEYTGWDININHSYTSAYKLRPDSLVTILSRLPQVSAVKTITLGYCNRSKLTDAQIAIATQKGWTVA